MSTFGEFYADAYDKLYAQKDYARECDMVEELFKLAHTDTITNILDLGCGTGGHAVILASRGYTVTGIDASEAMLSHARQKAKVAGVSDRTTFRRDDLRSARLQGEFEAAIMMFAVLGYQREDNDVIAALRTVRGHLSAGAPFVFDVWFGPAVVSDKPQARERTVKNGSQRIVRHTTTELDAARNLCNVKFDLEVWEGEVSAARAHEEHLMRFFFPEELQRFSSATGFELLGLRDFLQWRSSATPDSWNVVGLMRAV